MAISQTASMEIILSTDGKHTVITRTDQLDSTEHIVAWATSTYDRLVKKYGLKKDQYTNGETKGNGNSRNVPVCAVHKVPMVKVEGKHGPFWSCHQRNADGSFCSYKPNGR